MTAALTRAEILTASRLNAKFDDRPNPGFDYMFSTATADADPASGFMRLNHATWASATYIYLSKTDRNNDPLGSLIATLFASGGKLRLFPLSDRSGKWLEASITGSAVDATTYYKIPISPLATGGSLPVNGQIMCLLPLAAGTAGANGTNGTNGVDGGVRWTFETSTTMSAPASGALRFNNATLASVTAIAVNYLCAETGNPTVADLVKVMGDATTVGNKARLIIKKISAPENFAIFKITAAVTDNTTWGQITVTVDASNGTLSASDMLSVQWLRTGDKGTDGAGSGTVSPTGTIVANRIATYNDTTGNVIKDGGATISTDGTFASNVDTKVPTEKAVKTYVDALLDAANAMQYKGTIDCSANPNYPAASAGHLYVVSVAGKIGGASGVNVEAGDWALCKTDSTASGNHATVGAQWGIVQFNVDSPLKAADIGSTVQGYDANTAKVNVTQTWTKPQKGGTQALTSATAWDAAASAIETVDVNGANFTIANPTGATAIDGQLYHFRIKYSTSHTLAWGSKFKGIAAVTWSNTSGKRDRATFEYNSADDAFYYVGHSLDVGA